MEGWLESDLCAKARHEEVKYIPRHRVYTRVSRETCFRETRSSLMRTGWAETDKGQPGTPNMRARWVAKDSNQGPREAGSVRTHTAVRGTEDFAVGDRHGWTWKDSCGIR